MNEEIKQRIVAKTGKIKSFNNSIGVEYGVRGRGGGHRGFGPRRIFLYGLAPKGFWLFMDDMITG